MPPHSSLMSIVLAVSCGLNLGANAVDQIWIDRLDGPASMNDYGEAIAVAPDGSVYVAGSVFEQVQSNLFAPRFMTIKYDTDGSRVWTRTYAGTFASGSAAAGHIAIDVDGNIVVAGSTNQGNDWAVLKYDPTGAELWRYVYQADSTFLTHPADMALDASGNVYLVGSVGEAVNPSSGALVKVGADGTEAWTRNYYGPSFDGATFNTVTVDSAGHVYAGGAAVVPGRASELCVVQYDEAGTQGWLATDGAIASTAHDRALDLAVDASGNIIAVGSFGHNSTMGVDLAVVKLDPSGTSLWRATYIGTAGRTDAATQLAVDGDGNIVVVGYSGLTFDDYDALTLKYSASGSLLWERRVGGDDIHFDWATSVALDSGGNIYVAGAYDPIGGSRFFTVRYDSDGAENWFMDYAGPVGGGSRANGIAVGADARVYVTGDSDGGGTAFDIATIRYDQPVDATAGDLNADGVVGFSDLIDLMASWGSCAKCAGCPADIDGNCQVGMTDLLILLSNWS